MKILLLILSGVKAFLLTRGHTISSMPVVYSACTRTRKPLPPLAECHILITFGLCLQEFLSRNSPIVSKILKNKQ